MKNPHIKRIQSLEEAKKKMHPLRLNLPKLDQETRKGKLSKLG